MNTHLKLQQLENSLLCSGFEPFSHNQLLLGLKWRDRFGKVIMEFQISWSESEGMYVVKEDGVVIFHGRTAQQVTDTVWNRAVQIWEVLQESN